MTGPEHYTEAERLLAGHTLTEDERARGIEGNANWLPSLMDLHTAQVHATLALAAATASTIPGVLNKALLDWNRALVPKDTP